MTPDDPSGQDRAAEMAAFPEMNPGPVVRTDPSGRILLLNSAASGVFGDADAIGRTWLEACPSVDVGIWRRVLAGEDRLQHDAEIDGRHFTFVYRRPAGVTSIFIYGSDITARKRAEQRLAKQAAQIAEMARFPDMNPGPVFRVDPTATVLLANAAARELFGGESLIGQRWMDLCPGLDDATWRRILGADDVTVIEARLDQRSFLFSHRVAPDGRLVFVYGNDVTALRATEDALRQSERMATLGTLAAGVAHELNNPAAAAIRAAGQLAAALAPLQDAAIALGAVELAGARGTAVQSLVEGTERGSTEAGLDPLRRGDLETAVEEWLTAHGMPRPWDLAPALVAIGCGPDDLERLAADWGDCSAAVIQWIATAASVRTLATDVSEASVRISRIVGALKSYTFLDQTPLRSVDVSRGLEDTLTLMRGALEPGVTVLCDYAPDLPEIEAVGSELNQVWTHLLQNAVDAMGGRGRLAIRTRREESRVVVEIEDDGPGIPEELRSRIFDAFFTTKPPGKGTGMGLATCRNIVVKNHDGSIDFMSRPGCTRFIVALPIKD